MTVPRTLVPWLAAALLVPHAMAAPPKPGDHVTPPIGFAAGKKRGIEQLVTYSRTQGERKNTIDRENTEQLCASFRKLDPAVPTPVFEAGHDKPNVVDSTRFENSRFRADFVTTTAYACSNAADLPKVRFQNPCGCIYRPTVVQHTYIRNFAGDGIESIDIDHAARTLRRYTGPGRPPPTGPDLGAEMVARLAPEVTGDDKILGMACQVRRQTLPGGGWQEWCVTPNDAKAVANPALRARSLRHVQFAPDRGGAVTRIKSDQLVELVVDVFADESAFAAPEGYAVKGPDTEVKK